MKFGSYAFAYALVMRFPPDACASALVYTLLLIHFIVVIPFRFHFYCQSCEYVMLIIHIIKYENHAYYQYIYFLYSHLNMI